jgi:hypothetical protein
MFQCTFHSADVPILNLSQLHAETFNPANRSKRNAPIVALPTKAQPQNTDRQQSNQSDIQKSDVVISPRALSPSYLNSTESSKRRSASTEKTERALLLPKSVMSPSKSSSMVVSDKPSKPVSLNLNTADTEARAITSPPRVSVRNSTTAATLAKQVHRVSRTGLHPSLSYFHRYHYILIMFLPESVSPPRPRSATAIARAAAAAETHIRRLHKLQEPEIVPVRSERKIVRAPQSRVTLTETTNIEMPVESELDSEHGHNAMVDSVPAASDPPSPASFLSSFISNNPFAGSTSFAYPIMSTPAQSNRSFVTDTSASPETPHVTNSSSTLAFDSNRTHFQDLTTPVPPSKVTDYGSPVLKATTQSIPAISSTAILSSPAQVFCLPVEEPTPAVSLSDSAPNETPNETVSVTHFAELEQSRKTIETLISEIETVLSFFNFFECI